MGSAVSAVEQIVKSVEDETIQDAYQTTAVKPDGLALKDPG